MNPPHGVQSPSLAQQSQDVLELFTNAAEPGCSAAVARQGELVWRGVHGLADLHARSPITARTVFDIGSVSKQFTASAILLLRDAGKLRLDDPLAEHLPGLPPWAETTTLAQLMHHTSVIPDYQQLLQDEGFEFTDPTTQEQALHALAGVRKLDFTPGADWAYSNSNYVLLGEVVRRVSGQDLPRYLKTRVFDPLGLDMVVERNVSVPEKAISYGGSPPHFEAVHSRWSQVGDGGIQTTPSELARWGDNYRTGELGGRSWPREVVQGAVDVPIDQTIEKSRYGAGIFVGEDGWIGHPGEYDNFLSGFWVSPDRNTSIALSCNRRLEISDMLQSLISIWSPS